MPSFSSEMERVETTYRFLTSDEMEHKASALNSPLDDVLNHVSSLEKMLKDELAKQSGAITKKIEEEWNSKVKNTQAAISHMKEENTSHVHSYRNIAEELRTQNVTLYYKKIIPSL